MHTVTRAGIAVVPPHLRPRWDAESDAILDILDSYHRHAASYRQITGASLDGIAGLLRDDLRCAAPSLTAFVDHLMASLEAAGCAAYVPDLGLSHHTPDHRARLFYALSTMIGTPSPTDARDGRILWDVTLRPTASGYYATFSEHDGEAAFHTDTQYYPMPERWVALYVMAPAACGGGESLLCDGETIRAALDHPKTRWALETLEHCPLPFRIPSLFTTDDRPGAVQATLAPVFSSTPGIRYRRDTVLDGWTQFPEHHSHDAQKAVDCLERTLADPRHSARFTMPKDSLLLTDNHRALHARTAFSDRKRHLLRVRMRGDELRSGPNAPMVSTIRAPTTALARTNAHAQ